MVLVSNEEAKYAASPEHRGDEKHPHLRLRFDILRRFDLNKLGFRRVAHEKHFSDHDRAHKNHMVHPVAPHQIQIPRVLKRAEPKHVEHPLNSRVVLAIEHGRDSKQKG